MELLKAETTTKGHSFAVDSRIWGRVTARGMNEAVAYLVLMCGTGKGNGKDTTLWSTESVKKYAGVGWERAKTSIEQLIEAGFIRLGEDHTASEPRYTFASLRELADSELAKVPPDYFDIELLRELQAGKQPKGKAAGNRAERLHQRGLVRKDAQGIYQMPEPVKEDGDNLIWLPNTIVTGTPNGEVSPIRKLRSAGCVWTLRLFADLYASHNLRDDGGISPRLLWLKFERRKIAEQGAYTIWGFKPVIRKLNAIGPFAGMTAVSERSQRTNTLHGEA